MRKVKCGIENAEWRSLVELSNHVTAVIPHITASHIRNDVTNRQSSKMWNAENANNEARYALLLAHTYTAEVP